MRFDVDHHKGAEKMSAATAVADAIATASLGDRVELLSGPRDEDLRLRVDGLEVSVRAPLPNR